MSSFQTFRLVPVRDDIRGEADEWAGLGDAKERRKRQNRINKRAARQRQRIHGQVVAPDLTNGMDPPTASGAPTKAETNAGTLSMVSSVYFLLTRDSQLLHVISLNVSRAVLTNYFIICSVPLSTPQFCSVPRVFTLPSNQQLALVSGPVEDITLPPSLLPTQIQQRVPHPGWVDLFPFPQVRDNLILAIREYRIDEDAFMMDLLGEAFASLCFADEGEDKPQAPSDPLAPHASYPGDSSLLTCVDPNEHPTAVTPGLTLSWLSEPGLVSWSDPWDITGWEVTEPFMRKWGFLLNGCQDVITATNMWRELRGEDPLVFKTQS